MWILRLLLLFAVSALALVLGLFLLDLESLALLKRLNRGVLEDSARMQLYAEGWRLLMDHPFIGAGIEPLGWYPHNLILESFLLSGVISGIIFAALFFFVALKAVHVLLSGTSNSWIPLIYLQYAVGAMFSFAIYSSVQFWVLMAAVAVMGYEGNRMLVKTDLKLDPHRHAIW
jgi:O-antigen ligase